MTTLLISDLHLHPGAPEITESFLTWLDTRASQADALYILGDFFDAWIGDDLLDHVDAEPTGQANLAANVATALHRVSDAGTEVFLMHGNRDFLLGERFAAKAGAQLLPDPSVVMLGDRPVLLMHGDSLCTRDEAYVAFRSKARDPDWQRSILAMPLLDRLDLAKSLRQQSGEATSNKAEDIMDVTPEEVITAMREHGVTTLIHGHTHRPAVHNVALNGTAGQRYVLGDWQPGQGWEILIQDDASPELRKLAI